jgi:hypothetical protein
MDSSVGEARAAGRARNRRLRSPVLLLVGLLLAFEAVGGLWIFIARLLWGTTPGEALHVGAGLALTMAYALYQWGHWRRVRPYRSRLDYTMGLVAALAMGGTNLTGLALGWQWWNDRAASTTQYATWLSAAHNIGSMLVLTFVAAHVGAVLMRARAAGASSS